jgi:hypothetical protein
MKAPKLNTSNIIHLSDHRPRPAWVQGKPEFIRLEWWIHHDDRDAVETAFENTINQKGCQS